MDARKNRGGMSPLIYVGLGAVVAMAIVYITGNETLGLAIGIGIGVGLGTMAQRDKSRSD